MRRMVTFLLPVLLLISLSVSAGAVQKQKSKDIVVLFTNDVHANIDGQLRYDTVSALKKKFQEEYEYVLLLDAGDHIQGTAFGMMDQGSSVVELMNRAGYDAATPGDHEFDYGMDAFLERVQEAQFPYLSCNLLDHQGETLLDSFSVFRFGKEIVAVLGITTPESVVKTAPKAFQGGFGERWYSIAGENGGSELYSAVQNEVDLIRRAGATKVIALGHLGEELSASPWSSRELIANVSGIDAFIDGHSHSVDPGTQVADKEGKNTHLMQAGENLEHIGLMIIDYETGEIRSDLISCEEIVETRTNWDGTEITVVNGYRLASELYSGPQWLNDYQMTYCQNQCIKKADQFLKGPAGKASVVFDNYDDNGTCLALKQETNSGDLAADALYFLFDEMGLSVDAAIVNGENIRNKAITGTLTYQTCQEVHVSRDMACLQKITGQQLLDALEWGARFVGDDQEAGGILHVSGIRYKIDDQWPDSTRQNDEGVWIGGPVDGYRVHDVQIYEKATDSWKDLDKNADYQVAGYRGDLKEAGGGFAMLASGQTVADHVMEDYLVLANYIQGFENQTVMAANSPLLVKYPGFGVNYESVNGAGRIVNEPADHTPEPAVTEPMITEAAETTEKTEATESVDAPAGETRSFPVFPVLIAVAAPILIVRLLFANKKWSKERKKEE